MDATTARKGIFDRSTKGTQIEPVKVLVERGRIRFFSQVLGQTDPIHFDLDAARAAGHPDLVAPPSFFMVIEAAANEERKRLGITTAQELVRVDYRYLLHGEERYFYEAPIYAGDEVEIGIVITDFYDKKGGAMEFVTFESRIVHPERGLLVRSQRSLLHRLPEPRS
ncbi:MaoC family dehydratase N-terminal domain-containing protein [Sphingopyxis sp. PET50]|uniref:MaoC family dehydratase N-terminal domain-containing protein n=1 Tax=Sphingopyxis sp. PET50 TaxID=2976533 RepID=UPI0021AFD085|nr:MaoC family dehydratase N-terminal domain-containing protein [Sphingopyxis sp. PET50]